MDVQDRLVQVLDNFDAICTDLNIGLPAEIEARQKQYEYYGKVDTNISELDKYRKIVELKRKESDFYNAGILAADGGVVCIDDLFKRYDELLRKINE